VFTFLTVYIARFDFGAWNFPIAMLIASAKAIAVMLFFMGLKYDDNQNRAIFFSGFGFSGIFILFVALDFFARPPGQTPGAEPFFAEVVDTQPLVRPWEPTEELIAHGMEVYFDQACHTCHGDQGFGDGPAGLALGARDFHSDEPWVNGRKPSEVYRTLMDGLGAMPAYPTMSARDRWAVTHYILEEFGPSPEEDTAESLAAVGIDITAEDGGLGEEVQRTIPVDFAIERYLLR